METFLFTAALLAFAGVTLNCLRLAYGRSLGWGVACTIMPISWIPFYGLEWDRIRIQGVVHTLSLIALLFFSALYMRANPFVFDQGLLAGLRDRVAPAFGQTPLSLSSPKFASDYEINAKRLQGNGNYGRYLDREYRFDHVVFTDNMLRFKQLDAEEPVEFAIDLHGYDVAESGSLVLDLTPTSTGFPLVHVMQYQPHSALPQVSSFERGYWLELILDRVTDARYQGQVVLKLPDGRKGYLAGNFNASARDLIWEFGDVKRSHDSNDTIEYVAGQYLVNNLGSSLLNVVDFHNTFFQTNLEESTGHTRVTVAMVDGSIHDIDIGLFKNDDEWVVERTPVRELIGALQTIRKAPPAAIAQQPVLQQVETFGPEDLESLVGRKVALKTHDGKTREGTVGSVDRYNVSLVTLLGGGEVALMVKRREVKEVRVQD
ncbi:MAG: hypothetical protein CMK89_09540 [Pseudomonadales bacterium]|nr:hypothetical protein [Pseudomonadales bacterium]RLU01825.1 MAG: hypothetical protein D9N11_11365 [Ketobacter sp.]